MNIYNKNTFCLYDLHKCLFLLFVGWLIDWLNWIIIILFFNRYYLKLLKNTSSNYFELFKAVSISISVNSFLFIPLSFSISARSSIFHISKCFIVFILHSANFGQLVVRWVWSVIIPQFHFQFFHLQSRRVVPIA